MAINFPANPSINDTFIVSGTIFTWTGVKWKSTAVTEISSDASPQLGGDLDLNSRDITGTGDINIVGIITATNIDLSSGYDKTFELHGGSTLDVDLNVPGPYLMIGDGTSVTLNFTNASTSTVAYSKEIWLTQDASASDLASSGHTVNGSAAGSIVKTGTMNGSSGELDVALVRLAYYGSEWKINIFVH